MATFVLRVWLPDRPGALGAVASRIGAVRGDLVGIDILERGAGRAIDELVVQLPDATLRDLMVREVSQVDGVEVEDIRVSPSAPVDPRLDALGTAAHLVERDSLGDLLPALCSRAARDLEAEWAAVVDPGTPEPLAWTGAVPPRAWFLAFVEDARAAQPSPEEGGEHHDEHRPVHRDGADGHHVSCTGGADGHLGSHGGGPSSPHRASHLGPADVAWAEMPVASLVVVLGRDGRPFRARERRQLVALARIADHRWADLVAPPDAAVAADGSGPAGATVRPRGR